MKSSNNRGSITIYFIITLSAIFILSTVLFDIVRTKTATNEVNEACELAAISGLSFYDKNLNDLFGIHGIQSVSKDKVSQTVKTVFQKNLTMSDMANNRSFFEFIPYKALDATSNLIEPLDTPEFLNKQIIEFAKINAASNISASTLPILKDFSVAYSKARQTINALTLACQTGMQPEYSPLCETVSTTPQALPANPLPKDPRPSANALWQSFVTANKTPESFGSFTDTSVNYTSLPSVTGTVYNTATVVIAPEFQTSQPTNINLYQSILKYFDKYKNTTPENLSILSNEIVVSEYLLSTFKNQYTDKTPSIYDLKGNLMPARPSYNTNLADVEYILNGHYSSLENIKLLKQQLLYIRFIQNLASICDDTAKLTHAKSLAINISSATGESKALLESQILLTWVLSESIIDANIIANNISLPIKKSPENWLINPNSTTNLSDSIVNASKIDFKKPPTYALETVGGKIRYYDILKLISISTESDATTVRTADLIQILYQKATNNPNFLLSNTFANVNIQAKVQIPYISGLNPTKEIIITNQR